MGVKEFIQWIRTFSNRYVTAASERDAREYARFLAALSTRDIEAYVYEEHGLKGQVVLLKGEELHCVTVENLVSFRELNRRDSRWLRNKYSKQLMNDKSMY